MMHSFTQINTHSSVSQNYDLPSQNISQWVKLEQSNIEMMIINNKQQSKTI